MKLTTNYFRDEPSQAINISQTLDEPALVNADAIEAARFELEQLPEKYVGDFTIDMLAEIATSPPDSDPFVIYLYEYIDNLKQILERINIIKASEKSIKKRLRDAEKVLEAIVSTAITSDINDEERIDGLKTLMTAETPLGKTAIHEDFKLTS